MDSEIRKKLKGVPQFVRDAMYEDCVDDAMEKIVDNYAKDDKRKLEAIKNTIGLTILKDVKIENLFTVIKEALKLNEKIAGEITLIILTKILYPIKDYFPGIEDEILKLGGEVPKEKPRSLNTQLLKREKEMEAMQEEKEREEAKRMADAIINDTIENLIKKYPKVGECVIGSQEAIEVKGLPLPMKPLVKYWLEDYQEKMDYAWHSNIDRAHYVYQDKNTKSMNEEERRQLNLVLKSLDEKILLPYSTRMGKIDFSKIE